ncbi:MAG: heparinase II/III family protein [Candidatus Latescibacteria bacterium]|nr:heparinase II/III family protein [Candidatus Latescibacterota bacterium]
MNLITSEQATLARDRVSADPTARKVADSITAAADPWLAREDDAIRALVPEAAVPRSFYVNHVVGCPIHGHGQSGGLAAWRHDPFNDPWHVVCATGGETYPSNDFGAYYRSSMEDRSLLTGPHADDGFGWKSEDSPYRHWFIAYCSEHLLITTVSGAETLAQAYLLTGDARYAHKALVILDRIAEVYPDMDYAVQGSYGMEFSPGYDGRIENQIHEGGTVRSLCKALDVVRDAIPSDPTFGPSSDSMRAKLEQGIIAPCLEGIYGGKIRGNYGGHQESVLVAALASGDRQEIDRAVDWVLNQTGEATARKEMLTSFDDYIFRDRAAHAEGVNFALDNLHFREGIGWESSPSYNSGWVGRMTTIARYLERQGVSIWDRPKLRRMWRWAVEMTCLDRFVPAIGDAGSAEGGLVQLSRSTLRAAYARTRDPFVGELLRSYGDGFDTFDSLFEEVPEVSPSPEGATELRRLSTVSHLMGGYGLVLLRSGRGDERTAVSLYYGRAATEHGHFDRLNLELFGCCRKLIPDMGYPEHASEGEPPAIWTKNTASHNTVVVDERRQDTQTPGRLIHFASSDGLDLVEADAPDAYHHVSEYRRTVALIELAPDARYVVDLFRVAGGDRHDYGIHGFHGTFSTEGVELSAPQAEGTLAGEDVPYGAIYDDEGLQDFERKGRSYYTYRGSGHSYLYDVRRANPVAPWSAVWRDAENGTGIRATYLPSGETIVAHGDPPRKGGAADPLDFLILRNSGEGLTSQFAGVLEPFSGQPRVRSIEPLERTDRAIGLKVHHLQGVDTVRHSVGPEGSSFSIARTDVEGVPTRLHLVGLGCVSSGGCTLAIEKGISGTVVAVDPDVSTLDVERNRGSQPLRTRGLIGETVRIGNGRRSTAYTISSVEKLEGRRYRIALSNETFCIGRLAVTGINADGSGLSTVTCLYLASQGYYRGARLVDEERSVWLPVDDVKLSPHRPGFRRDGSVALEGHHDLDSRFASGDIAYLYDFGPGDSVSIAPRATAVRRDDGTFRLKSNCRAELTVS